MKKPGENIVLCCFSLSSDTKPHSQREAQAFFTLLCGCLLLGCFQVSLAFSSGACWGCGAALGDVGCLWQREGMWCCSCHWALWALPHCQFLPGQEKCFRQLADQQLVNLIKNAAAETATGTEVRTGDTGTST